MSLVKGILRFKNDILKKSDYRLLNKLYNDRKLVCIYLKKYIKICNYIGNTRRWNMFKYNIIYYKLKLNNSLKFFIIFNITIKYYSTISLKYMFNETKEDLYIFMSKCNFIYVRK